jgi:hypothetical protein
MNCQEGCSDRQNTVEKQIGFLEALIGVISILVGQWRLVTKGQTSEPLYRFRPRAARRAGKLEPSAAVDPELSICAILVLAGRTSIHAPSLEASRMLKNSHFLHRAQ